MSRTIRPRRWVSSTVIAVMYEGGIDQIGAPLAVYAAPATRFVGGFIGNPPMNFVKVAADRGVVRLGTDDLAVPGRRQARSSSGCGRGAVAGAFPRRRILFHVRVVEPMGSHVLLTGTILDQRSHRRPADGDIQPGAHVGLSVDPRRLTGSIRDGRAISSDQSSPPRG